MEEKVFTPNQQNALGLDRHISLTANAGSGKTAVLVERYLKIAVEKNIDLSKIVAITFTEKAAAELYSKISEAIEHNIVKAPQDRKHNYISLRRQLYSAKVSTIHSFCTEVLREFAVDADIDTGFSVADDTQSRELIAISFEEFRKEFFSPDFPQEKKESVKSLIRLFGSWAKLSEIISLLISKRKHLSLLKDRLYSKKPAEISASFNEIYSCQLDLIIRSFASDFIEITRSAFGDGFLPPKKGRENDKKNVNILLAKFEQGLANNINPLELLNIIGAIRDIPFTKSGFREFYKKHFDELTTSRLNYYGKVFNLLKCEAADFLLHKDLAVMGKSLIDVYNNVVNRYDEKKRNKGILDFEDLLLKTEQVISIESIRDILKSRLNYIMIDEYQDTNEIQYNIFLPLVNFLHENNFFVVGDEKQSIYMFREAELEVFRTTKEDIKRETGETGVLELEESFRMTPALALFSNVVFSRLMESPLPLFNEVGYSPIVCAKNEDLQSKIEILLADKTNDESIGDIKAEEIKLVAKRIKQLKNEVDRLNYRDIALLCRKRSIFSSIEKVFPAENIPYSVIGGDGFYQRQTVYDIYNYLSFIVNKEDDLALVGLLRSPFFMLSDAEILEVSLENMNSPYGISVSLWDKLQAFSLRTSLYQETVAGLLDNLKASSTVELVSLIRKITGEGYFLSVIASGKNGKAEIDNLEKLVKIAGDFAAKGFRTLYDFTVFLREAIENEDKEGLASPPDDSDTVKVLTIHKAKGLQYKAVFVVNMDTVPDSRGAVAKVIKVSKDSGLLTKLPVNNDFTAGYVETPVQKTYEFIRLKKELAEAIRLFYVAVTRAENYLFLSGAKTSESFKEPSFFSFLSRGLRNSFSGDNIELKGLLNRALLENGKYKISGNEETIIIPIIRDIQSKPEKPSSEPHSPPAEIFHVNIDNTVEFPSDEIYSATKISTFLQCPLKYKLSYEYGFGKFAYLTPPPQTDSNNNRNFHEFNPEEDDNLKSDSETPSVYNKISLFKGSIIHAALEKDVQINDIDSLIETILRNETDFTRYNLIPLESLTDKVKKILGTFYESGTYDSLSSFRNYKNEFKVSLRDSDYILYGIIDKVIFDGENKMIIVDYKTDNIWPPDEKTIISRGREYINQLLFYAYLLSKVVENREIEIRIVFVSYPGTVVSELVNPDSVRAFGSAIGECVRAIRAKQFQKNLKHCDSCQFSLNNGKCII